MHRQIMKIKTRNISFDENKHREVIEYYDQTRFDYNIAWANKENLAFHFGYYDENADKHAQALLNTNKILAEKAGVKSGDKVLDAGCGKGGSALWLAEHLNAFAVGITPVAAQVEDCREAAKEKELEAQTAFFQADFCHTPFEDQSFDVVWACESLCHAKDKLNFYKEAYRILKPGGRLIVAEYIRTNRPLAEDAEQLLRKWLQGWAIPDLDTADEHHMKSSEAGFVNIKIKDYTPYAWISLKNLHKISLRWLWIGRILRSLRIRSKLQHNNHMASIYQFQALNKNYWFYGHISAIKPL